MTTGDNLMLISSYWKIHKLLKFSLRIGRLGAYCELEKLSDYMVRKLYLKGVNSQWKLCGCFLPLAFSSTQISRMSCTALHVSDICDEFKNYTVYCI